MGRTAMIRILVLWLCLFVLPNDSFAGGYAIPPQTAKGAGLANAITAGVTDPSAVYTNPAALGEVEGNQIMGGVNYINTLGRVRNDGRESHNLHDDDFVPNLFANYHIPGTDLTLGLGTYTPFGLATSYGEDSFTRFAAIRTQLKTLYVTPSISWSPLPYLSVGGGISFVHSSAALSRSIFLFAESVGEGKIRITDTDNGYGYNLGVLIKPHETLKFGWTYRSRVDLDFDSADVKFRDAALVGGLSTRTQAKGIHIPLPPVISAGIQWQINPEWGLEFVYDFTRWSEFKRLRFRFDSPLPAVGGLSPIPGFIIPEDWRDTSTFRLGSYYRISKGLELRAGFFFDENPIPAKNLSPAVPGVGSFSVSSGLGYTWNKVTVDLGYMAVFYKTHRVSNNVLEGSNVLVTGGPVPVPAPGFPGNPGKDKYTLFQHFVSFHLKYSF
jgi:long-chain fatty acid transport protein